MHIPTKNKFSKQVRLLYLADIQGPELIAKRGLLRNLSFAGTAKVLAICEALMLAGCEVQIYSPGSVAERTGRYFSRMHESIINKFGTVAIEYGALIDDRFFRFFFGIFGALINTPRIIRSHSIDFLIIYNLTASNVLSALIARVFGCKVFLEYEDGVTNLRSGKFKFLKSPLFVFERLAQKFLSGVIGASEELNNRVNVKNSIVLPGILGEEMMLGSSNSRKKLWTPSRSLRMIYAGGMDESKGIDRFLIALKDVRFDFPIELVVCGSGPLSKQIDNLCHQNISNIKINFLGAVSRGELIEHLCWADVGINPHRGDLHGGNSWPFKIVEYLALSGTVFSNATNKISPELEKRLWTYKGDEIQSIANAMQDFLRDWPLVSLGSDERRHWALSEFSSHAFSEKLSKFLMYSNL